MNFNFSETSTASNFYFDFGNPFAQQEPEDMCHLIVVLGNQITRDDIMPLRIAIGQFKQDIMRCARDNRPIQVKCVKDTYTDSGKIIKEVLAFSNHAFVRAFGDEVWEYQKNI